MLQDCFLFIFGWLLWSITITITDFSSDFRRYQQEDAHEFMQCTLDKLERCFLGLKKSNLNFEDDNLVEKVFGGRFISKVWWWSTLLNNLVFGLFMICIVVLVIVIFSWIVFLFWLRMLCLLIIIFSLCFSFNVLLVATLPTLLSHSLIWV